MIAVVMEPTNNQVDQSPGVDPQKPNNSRSKLNFLLVAFILLIVSGGLIYIFYSLGYFDGVISMYEPSSPEVTLEMDDESDDQPVQQSAGSDEETEAEEDMSEEDLVANEATERTEFTITNELTEVELTLSVILPEGATIVDDPLTTGTEIAFPGGELSFGFPFETSFIGLTYVRELRSTDPGSVFRFISVEGDVLYASNYTETGVCEGVYSNVPAPCTTGRLWPNILVSFTGSEDVYEVADAIMLSLLVIE